MNVKRKAIIASSALTLAGAAVGALTLSVGGQHTATPPGAAGSIRAQRVDDSSGSPASVPSFEPANPGIRFVDLQVKNDSDNPASVCVDHVTNADNANLDDTTPRIKCMQEIPPHERRGLSQITIDKSVNSTSISATGEKAPSNNINIELRDGNIAKPCVTVTNTSLNLVADCAGF
jgi:hypothetical protein